jgi:hypothetical protein
LGISKEQRAGIKKTDNNLTITAMKTILEIFKVLAELEAKGCHSTFFSFGNGIFHTRIFKGEIKMGNMVFDKQVNLTHAEAEAELNAIVEYINNMRSLVYSTSYQCYVREFIKGEKSGEWQKTKPAFEFGKNATSEMQIDGSGYFITDPENSLQYYVDMKQLSETNK